MKVVHVIFERRHEAEVIGLLHREIAVPGYARLDGVALAREVERPGRRAYRSDDHNSLIIVVCADEIADRILQGVKGLRGRVEQGVRAYSMSAQEAA